jgi:hypothetical protein
MYTIKVFLVPIDSNKLSFGPLLMTPSSEIEKSAPKSTSWSIMDSMYLGDNSPY